MGGKPRETFAKRQKERARQEKQRDKIAKRQHRRSLQTCTPAGDNIDWTISSDGIPGDDDTIDVDA